MASPIRYPYQIRSLVLRVRPAEKVKSLAQNYPLKDFDQKLNHRPPPRVALDAKMLQAEADDENPVGQQLGGDLPGDGVMTGHKGLGAVKLRHRFWLRPGILRYPFQKRRLRLLKTEIRLLGNAQNIQRPV